MMHKNANDRIKIPQLKSHAWFVSNKVSFEEPRPGTNLSQSNLITESMMLEGDDPFDDFMNNKRLFSTGGSQSSGTGRISDISNISDVEENVYISQSIQEKMGQNVQASFKKNGHSSNRDTRMKPDDLEIIPEELRVITFDQAKLGITFELRLPDTTAYTRRL